MKASKGSQLRTTTQSKINRGETRYKLAPNSFATPPIELPTKMTTRKRHSHIPKQIDLNNDLDFHPA
jgi:hypothetical protein